MKQVVVIGGGTGNFTVLSGLKKHNVELSAIVSMADDGGSTGVLRDELGVLPPGDVRQCLVALSSSSKLMRSLMNYRFDSGGLEGHSFGNLLLSALEKVTGSFDKAVEEVGKILFIDGHVIPVTTHEVRLKMILNNRHMLQGEKEVYLSEEIDQGYSSIFLEPEAVAHPKALDAIRNADLIVFGPGGLYTSLIPNLLVQGIPEALIESKAKKAYIVNLMNRKGQTTGFKVSNYIEEIAKFIGQDVFDYILVNSARPPEHLIERYSEEGEFVECDLKEDRVVHVPLLGGLAGKDNTNIMARNLIRHHSDKLAEELNKIVTHL